MYHISIKRLILENRLVFSKIKKPHLEKSPIGYTLQNKLAQKNLTDCKLGQK